MANIKRNYSLEWQYRANYPMSEEDALSPIAGRSFFDRKRLGQMLDDCCEPIEQRQSAIHVYVNPKLGVHYMTGADASEGVGGDYQALWIEGQEGLERQLCAVIHSNEIRPDTFAYMAYQLLNEYYQPVVVCGADAYGTRFLEDLVALGYPLEKIYCSNREKGKLGYVETPASQEKALVDLEKAIRSGIRVRYKPAVLELFSYQLKSKGARRIAPAEGAHNDLVMGMAKANFGFSLYPVGGEVGVQSFY